MSLFRKMEFEDEFGMSLDLINPFPFPSPFDNNDIETSLLFADNNMFEVPLYSGSSLRNSYQLHSLSHRLSNLELAFDRQLARETLCDRIAALERSLDRHVARGNRKYTWEAEIKNPERSYKVTAEIKGGSKSSYKWAAEMKDGDDLARSYTFKSKSDGSEKKEKKVKKNKIVGPTKRVVQIEEAGPEHRAVALRHAKFDRFKGKRKEFSPQDAAMVIQTTFKGYLIRRCQALRALRELAVAKARVKELRQQFNNFTYRRRVAHDAEERQRFSEKIIVVLLTIDSIEGIDVMVRSAKRSMTDELEAMLDVVDPQSAGKSRFTQKRTFDMPDAMAQKELAAGVAEVVQMLDQENGNFEACL